VRLDEAIASIDQQLDMYEDAYYYLQAHSNDPQFHHDNFLELPVSYLMRAVEKIKHQHQKIANTAAHTTAYLAAAVHNYLSKDGGFKHSDFLPFSIKADEEKASANRNTLSRSAAKIFVKLYDEGQIPAKIVGCMGQHFATIEGYDL